MQLMIRFVDLMTRLRVLLGLLLLLGFVPFARVGGQEIQLQPFRPQEELSPDPTAARAMSLFSRAWADRDAERIAGMMAADSRANVTIESRGVSGQLSRGQVESLLSGLFSEAEKAAFDFSTIHHSGGSSAYAVGDWTYEAGRPPQRLNETVFVVFRESQAGSWILSELRIQPAR
jgi:ketosteroid isomerase-like protein